MAGLGDQFPHFSHGLDQSDHDGSGDDAVTDVEFHNLGQLGESFHIFIGQAMPGVDAEAELVALAG